MKKTIKPDKILIALIAANFALMPGCAELLDLMAAVDNTATTIKQSVAKGKLEDAATDAQIKLQAQKELEYKAMHSAPELYQDFPPRFERKASSVGKYAWNYQTLRTCAVTDESNITVTCFAQSAGETVQIAEAPHIVFNGQKISLETDKSYIKRHRYFKEFNQIDGKQAWTDDEAIQYRNALQIDIAKRQEARNAFYRYVNAFNNHPLVKFVSETAPLYAGAGNDAIAHILNTYKAKRIATEQADGEAAARYAYRFEADADWCYLALEAQNENGRLKLVDNMDAKSLATLNPYDDIQKFRARAEFDDLNNVRNTFHAEGACAVLPAKVIRNSDGFRAGTEPIVIGWPRNQVPEAVAMMAEAELSELPQYAACPKIDRTAEYTWRYVFDKEFGIDKDKLYFEETQIPRRDSADNTSPVNGSKPYAFIDYWKHPIPGTLFYIKSKYDKETEAVVVESKTANFGEYSLLKINGERIKANPGILLNSGVKGANIRMPKKFSAEISCMMQDSALSDKYKACQNIKDPFGCCENLMLLDFKAELEKIETDYGNADETAKSALQARLNLLKDSAYIDRQIHARCGIDETKAYGAFEKLFRQENRYSRQNTPNDRNGLKFSLKSLMDLFKI